VSGFRVKGLDRLLASIPQHSEPLPPEASSPIQHYRLGANDAWNLLKYFEYWRKDALDTLFQLRHTIAHNLAVVTSSDALKFRRLTRSNVPAPAVLSLTNGDIWYAKVFLDETVSWLNERIRDRVCVLMTEIHRLDATSFEPKETAAKVAAQFRWWCRDRGPTGVPVVDCSRRRRRHALRRISPRTSRVAPSGSIS